MLCPYSQSLCSLLAGHVASLVGVPYLLAMIAKLSLAAVSLTGQFRAAGTSIGNNSITKKKNTGQLRKSRILWRSHTVV